MSESTTARDGRDWIKIGAFALIPTLAAALLALTLDGAGTEAAAGTIPTSTTSTTTTVAAEGIGIPFDPADYELDDLSQPASDDEGAPAEPTAEDEDDEPQGPAQPSDDGEDDPPADALMALPSEVTVEEGKATIEVSNLGELPLEIYLVDVNDNPIEVGDVATEVGGYSSSDVELTVDTSGLPMGDYEMTVSISTNDGVGNVKVKGSKLFVFIPMLPDLDIEDSYVVPHLVNHVQLQIVNNETHDVTVTLSSDDARLDFPDEVELEPGDNDVLVLVQALPLHWSVIDILELKVGYGVTEMATVTIKKHGS